MLLMVMKSVMSLLYGCCRGVVVFGVECGGWLGLVFFCLMVGRLPKLWVVREITVMEVSVCLKGFVNSHLNSWGG